MINGMVSVIIPVYNRADKLKEAVMSVLLQSYTIVEIIIVDDGSTDHTSIVASTLAHKWPKTVFVYSQSNAGPGLARELGRTKAQGEFIQYLDSDDILLSEKLSLQTKVLSKNHQCAVVYGISYEKDYSFYPPLIRGPIRGTGDQVNHLFPRLLNERWWTTSSPLYRRSCLDRIGPWKNLVNEEDWEYDARLGSLNIHLIWIPFEVSIRRLNISHDHLSSGGYTDPRKLAHRVFAKQCLYEYALTAGVQHRQSEMVLFSRECFFMARQCAELGLEQESREMFNLALKSATTFRRRGLDFLIYHLFSHFIGWTKIGRLTSKLRNMLK